MAGIAERESMEKLWKRGDVLLTTLKLRLPFGSEPLKQNRDENCPTDLRVPGNDCLHDFTDSLIP